MKTPSPTALVERARTLVVRMHGVERWAYAIDVAVPAALLQKAILTAGYLLAEEDPAAEVHRYEASSARTGEPDGLVTLRRPDLGVTVLQAHGATTPDRLGPILETTGFVQQSRLLREAYEVGQGDLAVARRALMTLAHMVVAWDEDWADLFLLHLASPDPVVRHDAALATVVAAHSARSREPARTLLNEAQVRERFPELKRMLGEALSAVEPLPS